MDASIRKSIIYRKVTLKMKPRMPCVTRSSVECNYYLPHKLIKMNVYAFLFSKTFTIDIQYRRYYHEFRLLMCTVLVNIGKNRSNNQKNVLNNLKNTINKCGTEFIRLYYRYF